MFIFQFCIQKNLLLPLSIFICILYTVDNNESPKNSNEKKNEKIKVEPLFILIFLKLNLKQPVNKIIDQCKHVNENAKEFC